MEILENILPKVGDKLGSFELVNELGRGGVGLGFFSPPPPLHDDFALQPLFPDGLSLGPHKKNPPRLTRWGNESVFAFVFQPGGGAFFVV